MRGLSDSHFFTMAPGETVGLQDRAVNDIARMFPEQSAQYAEMVNAYYSATASRVGAAES